MDASYSVYLMLFHIFFYIFVFCSWIASHFCMIPDSVRINCSISCHFCSARHSTSISPQKVDTFSKETMRGMPTKNPQIEKLCIVPSRVLTNFCLIRRPPF